MSAAGQIRDIVAAALDEFLQALRGRDDEQQKQIDDLARRVEILESFVADDVFDREAKATAKRAAPAKKTAATKAQAGTAEVKGKAPGATTA